MRKIDCFIKGLWLSLKHGKWISGHDFELYHTGEDVEVLKCKYCDKYDVGWW